MRAITVDGNTLIRKKLLVLFSALAVIACFTILQINSAFAQESSSSAEEMAKKYNISFPIAELGNCSSIDSCKSYCSDEANKDACMSFAKKKGFYKEDNRVEGNAASKALLEKAKSELGCTSEDECRQVCYEEANRDKCMAFAKKYSINTHSQNPGNEEILEKAKAILGCDSPETCKAVCEQEANRDKCSQFAKSAGLRGGMERVGPGGCKSEDECKAFCSNPDNFEKCQRFGGGQGGKFHGPGGCNSKESCEQFCKENEDKCQGFKERFEDRRELETKCQENPEECFKKQQEIGKEMMDRDEFCRENPDKCKDFMPNSEKAFKNADERARFCRENPDKCSNTGGQFIQKRTEFEKREFEQKREFEKRDFEMRRESEKKEFEGRIEQKPPEFKEPEENKSGTENSGSGTSGSGSSSSGGDSGSIDKSVQGVSKTPSFFDWLFNVFLK